MNRAIKPHFIVAAQPADLAQAAVGQPLGKGTHRLVAEPGLEVGGERLRRRISARWLRLHRPLADRVEGLGHSRTPAAGRGNAP